jgi:alkanesulfonate monooxygenase SsuD/methylene tetrahydromethanopterin reductase-like flavin-dependent oxidoreductase (luciferase family)
MEIGLGVFSGECLPEEGKSPTEVLADSLAQMRLAEEVGLDEVWITEHHFLRSGYVGSVLPYAAAAATATRTIRIGVSVALAPLYDPVRLAEDAAFVDVLSGGRHDLGVAIGYRDVEYEGFGTTRADRVGRMEELCVLLRQCWGDGPLAFVGHHFRRHGMEVFPKPAQPGGVPLLMGGHAPKALDRAARLADAFIMDGGTDSSVFGEQGHNRDIYERVAGTLELWRSCLARHGRPTEAPRFYLTLGGFLHADGPDAAWAVLQEAYMFTRRTYADWYGIDPAVSDQWYPALMPPEEHAQRRTEVILGSPDDVIPLVRRLRDIVGDGLHVMFRSKYPGIPDADTQASIRLLGEVRRAVG